MTTENVVSAGNVSDSQAHTAKAQALAKSGETAAALDEFNHAVGLDPYNAQALYGRALIYQGNNQHDFAIADFSAAERPQSAEGRAVARPRHQLSRPRQGQGGRGRSG